MDSKLWEMENYRSFLEERRKALADLLNQFIDSAYASGSVGLLDADKISPTSLCPSRFQGLLRVVLPRGTGCAIETRGQGFC